MARCGAGEGRSAVAPRPGEQRESRRLERWGPAELSPVHPFPARLLTLGLEQQLWRAAETPRPGAQSLGGSPSCLPFQRGAPQPPLPAAWLPALFPAPSHSLGLFPLLPPTSSRQVPNCPPGFGLSGRGACSCQSQKYSLMTQLEDKSPDWLLQAKYRAGWTTCPLPKPQF